jgi:hypothetical protein
METDSSTQTAAYNYFHKLVTNQGQLSRLVGAATDFVKPVHPDPSLEHVLLGKEHPTISQEKSYSSVIKYGETLKEARDVYDVIKHVITFVQLECSEGTSEARFIGDISKRDSRLSKTTLRALINDGRNFRELLLQGGPGDLLLVALRSKRWLVVSQFNRHRYLILLIM